MNNTVRPQVMVPPPPPGVPGSFATSLTVVRWQGMEVGAGGLVRLGRVDEVASRRLPRLVSSRPRLLLDVVLGLYASRAQRHGLAAEFFERAAQGVRAGLEGAQDLYRMLGSSYLIAGRKDAGLAALKEALRACQPADLRCRQVGLHHIGWAYARLGEKRQALALYEESLTLARQRRDPGGEGATLNNIGMVQDSLGDKKKALEYYERALPLRQKAGDVSGEATTLNNIGGVHSSLGDKKKALEYYERALALVQKVGDVSGEGVTLDNMASALYELGRPADAVARYQQAAACYLRRNPPDVEEAGGSLVLAFKLALRAGLHAQAAALLKLFEALRPSELQRVRMRARLSGRSGAREAPTSYRPVRALAASLPPADQAHVRAQAAAGEARHAARARWPDCPGLVITQVVPGSHAARLDLRVGDVILRYASQCLHEPEDLIAATGRTRPEEPVTLDLWRGGGEQKVEAQGGKLGMGSDSF